jgi:hypothetical protein
LGTIVAGVTILISILILKSPVSDVFKETGVALIAAGVFGFAIDFFSKRQLLDVLNDSMIATYNSSDIPYKLDRFYSLVKIADELTDLGVKVIRRERNDNRAYEIIKDAYPGSTIKILGISLQSFTSIPVQHIFIGKLKEGCNIQLLALDPSSQFVKRRATEEKRTHNDIFQSISHAIKAHSIFIESLGRERFKGKIAINYYDAPPNLSLVITETNLLVGFYLRERKGQFFPQMELEVKPHGISEPFINHFDSLMKESKQMA